MKKCLLALAFLISGCAGPGSYAVLLPNPDGTVGKIIVRSASGDQVLTQAQTGVRLDGSNTPVQVSTEQLTRDFGAAIFARPPLPERFLLYFASAGTRLMPESSTLLKTILVRIKERTHVDLSVTGHTDSLRDAATNVKLGLSRANAIADQLRQMGVPDSLITVESHGERNLLVPTPDETLEPLNRRVEIMLR